MSLPLAFVSYESGSGHLLLQKHCAFKRWEWFLFAAPAPALEDGMGCEYIIYIYIEYLKHLNEIAMQSSVARNAI